MCWTQGSVSRTRTRSCYSNFQHGDSSRRERSVHSKCFHAQYLCFNYWLRGEILQVRERFTAGNIFFQKAFNRPFFEVGLTHGRFFRLLIYYIDIFKNNFERKIATSLVRSFGKGGACAGVGFGSKAVSFLFRCFYLIITYLSYF